MSAIFKKIFFILSITLLSLFVLTTTQAGLEISYFIMAKYLPGTLKIEGLQGSLIKTIKATKISYKHQKLNFVINNLSLNYQINITKFIKHKNLEPLIRGKVHINVFTLDNLQLQEFQGSFSANDAKTIVARAQFKGNYNKLFFDGSLKYNNKMQVQLISNNNQLNIQGQFPYPWQVNALIKEPGLLDPELKDLQCTISADGLLTANEQGNLKINLSEGYFSTKAIDNVNFLGAEIFAKLQPKTLTAKGLLTIDNGKKFTFNAHVKNFKDWQATGNLYDQSKTVALSGQGILQPEFKGTATLQATEFPIMATNEYKIWASPNIQATFTAQTLNINGSILIPKAQIIPQTFENSLVLSDDAVFTDAEDQSLPLDVSAAVDLTMGDNVYLDIKGLKAFLIGHINLNKTNQGPITATGQLSVKNGKYKAYGQDLSIDQGQLLFTGGLVTNPGIQLKAIKKFTNTSFAESNQNLDFNNTHHFGSNTTVGVEVTGWLNNPKIELFANPATLSQADILSMLILGRPVSEASKSGSQLLLAAISSMDIGANSKGAQLLEQVKNNLGVDVNIKNNSSYNQGTNSITDSTGVEIGKSLSKRLYLSYNRGLTTQTNANTLTLKYLLSKFFSIQVTANENGNGIDLLYSSQNKKNEKHEKSKSKSQSKSK